MSQQPADPVTQKLGQIQQHLQQVHTQLLRVTQLAQATRAEMMLTRAGRPPRRTVEFTSQYGEDLLAWGLFEMQAEGFFIEVGAFDGYHYSVTYGFEAMGWHGLLVEALPGPAAACRERRPNSRVVHAALSKRGSSGETTFQAVEDQYGGMLSYLKTGTSHEKDVSWAKKQSVTVPLTTMNDLLADHDGPIDLAVIDVEGGELDLLDGFDLTRYRPRVMLIEDNTMGRDPALQRYMSDFPYQFVGRVAVNDIFIRSDEKELIERMRWVK